MTKQIYRVHGVVVHHQTKQPLPGLRVEAWDKDLLVDDLLGGSLTDPGGRFTIVFDTAYFSEVLFDRRPDVFFRIFVDDRLVADTQRSVICNVASERTDVTIEVDVAIDMPSPPALDRAALEELRTRADQPVAMLPAQLFAQLQALALAALVQQVRDAFGDTPAHVREHVKHVDFAPLLGGATVRDLLRASFEQADDAIREYGMSLLDELVVPDTLDEVLRLDTPVRDNPVFRRSLEQGATWRLAALLKLDDATTAALQQRALHPGNLNDARLASLVREGVLSEARAKELGLVANLFHWTDGRAEMIHAIRETVSEVLGQPMVHLADLARLQRADYAKILERAQVSRNQIAEQADRMARTIEALFPRQTLEAQHRPVKAADIVDQLEHPSVQRLAARHAGLRLDQVLADPALDAPAKAAEIARRIDLIGTLYQLNPKVSIATVDTLGGELQLGQLSEADRALVLDQVRMVQRLLRVTGGSAEHAYALAEAGYHSALAIAETSPGKLAVAANLNPTIAEQYRNRALDLGVKATAAGGAIIDRLRGGMAGTPNDNASPEVDEFLHRLPDYTHYFGNQAFCRCTHCASLLSPAAYFVDLMEYVTTKILEPVYGSARPSGRPLSLYDRRRDLWNGIPLTCAATDTLEPYLTIINEILENYIHAPATGTRAEIEAAVYRRLYERGTAAAPTPNGFRQPFLLPLERVQIYLESLSLSRGTIAAAVFDGASGHTAELAQARLALSPREYLLIETARTDATFLRGLYLLDSLVEEPMGTIAPLDVQQLLAPMGITRDELTASISSTYVRGADSIRIELATSPGSVQPDLEQIRGLTRASLDRLHRFTRLRRRLPWTIGELDLVLGHLGATSSLPIAEVAALRALQERLQISVEEACALCGPIPTKSSSPGGLSLFSRLFDLPMFARTDAERWVLRDSNGTFVHPAFRTDPSGAGDATRSRLLAGLKIDDESLLALLGASAEAGIELTHANLARLYQHARLAALMGLSVADLLQLLQAGGMDTSRPIASIAELEERLAFVDWWRASTYTVDDLAFVTGGTVRETAKYPRASQLVADVARDIKQRRLLVFADTVFGFFEGVTEEQSRAIIEANPTVFLAAELRLYRVSDAVNLATATLALPASVPASREPELRDRLRALTLAGAPPFDETVFAGLVSEEESRAVFAANPGFFVAVESPGQYWLAPDLDPAAPLVIPAGVPIGADAALQYIVQFHISNVVRGSLAARLATPVAKLDAIMEAARFDLSSPATAAPLARAIQTGELVPDVETLFAILHRLSVLFAHRAFTPAAIRFVGEQAAPGRLFSALDLRVPTIAGLQAVVRYRTFIASEQQDLAALHEALLGYVATAVPPRFSDDAVTAAATLLGADRGLVATLARTLPFPGGATGDSALRALVKLRDCVQLAQKLGAGADVLTLLAPLSATGDEYVELDRAASALFAAIRSRHDSEERWKTVVEPLEDQIRQRRRDALSDFIIRTLAPGQFHTTDDLYHWFLIDTQLEGCARTSRVVAGISSLQLYVQRVLLRLEQTGDGTFQVAMDEEAAAQWEWRKNYRLWEANRRVFLFPERYLIQEVRDDKTELFEAEEAQILQQDITEDTVMDVYTRYLDGFTEIAGLQIAGAYHDTEGGRDTLHLFGVTRSDPPTYYYREIENVYRSELPASRGGRGIAWYAWCKLPVQIAARKVSPVVIAGRLYLLWLETTTRGRSPFDGYTHTRSLRFTARRIDGTWTPPQRIELGKLATVSDLNVETSELTRLYDEVLSPAGVARSNQRLVLGEIQKLASEDPVVLTYSRYSMTSRYAGRAIDVPFSGRTVRELFMPKYELGSYGDTAALHLEAKDDYRLVGEEWERAFPTVRDSVLGVALWNGLRWNTSALDRYRLRLDGIAERSTSSSIRRLYSTVLSDGRIDIGTGLLRSSVAARAYAEAYELGVDGMGFTFDDRTRILANAPSNAQLSIVNGSLTDGIIDVDGDLFYLYRYPEDDGATYILKRLGTTLAAKMEATVLEGDVAALLSISNQEQLAEAALPFEFRLDAIWNDAGKAVEKSTPDFTGSLGVYFREVFFHLPSLIAEHLNSQQQYAAAQRWYHFIFDPTSTEQPDPSIVDPEERERRRRDRVWQYVEFRNRTLQSMREQLGDAGALEAYANDPFNPHAIARHRIDAYMRGVFMRYVENLLDWGDQLFARDTMESINEATLLYVMASNLLGPRPPELGDCADPDQDPAERTYDAIATQMARCPRTAIESFEHVGAGARPPAPAPGGTGLAIDPRLLDELQSPYLDSIGAPVDWSRALIVSFGSSLLRQVCVFCIPPNRDLHALWDRVEDRLYKIRNCMNLAGERRQLALFAPPIDPMLLVRAKAAGLSIHDVLDTTSGNVPPYRFSFLIAKAKEYAAGVQAMGAALMSALERKDAEELAQLRMVHQQNVLAMSRRLREQEIEAAEASLAALVRRKTTITNRRDHFQALIDAGWSDWEEAQVGLKIGAHATKLAVPILNGVAGAAAVAPSIAGTAFSTPADNIDRGVLAAANVVSALADIALISADLVGTQAAFERREEGWRHQVAVANDELAEIEKQIEAQSIRVAISRRSLDLHLQSEQQLDETFAFYRDKFPNLALYTWLASTLQGLYREAYQSAYTMARLAERAYRFERGDDSAPLLRGTYWDASRAGLLAGERLLADLRDLERRYMETHYRGMEIDQAFSVLQLDPEALIALKETGSCEVVVPELYFDLAYPGQYRRRIQSARLTIPCITGPYTNVGATMTLLESAIRVEPELGPEHLVAVPPTRSVTIATSTAQNDGGVFRLDFRDERYMPFEGAGAVNSRWRITLPSNFRPFDYSTINDVILHISYTAEYSRELAASVQERLAETEGSLVHTLEVIPSRRALSLRQEFSSTFHRLLHVPAGDGPGAPLEISEKHFPLFLQGRALQLRGAFVILVIDEEELDVTGEIVWPTIEVTGPGGVTSLELARNGRFGGLPHASFAVPTTELQLRNAPLALSFAVRDAGHFGPRDPHPSDPSPLDPAKLKDVCIYLEYVLARPRA